jgi:hypothetical protein
VILKKRDNILEKSLVYGIRSAINVFPTMSIILPESDPTITERGRG